MISHKQPGFASAGDRPHCEQLLLLACARLVNVGICNLKSIPRMRELVCIPSGVCAEHTLRRAGRGSNCRQLYVRVWIKHQAKTRHHEHTESDTLPWKQFCARLPVTRPVGTSALRSVAGGAKISRQRPPEDGVPVVAQLLQALMNVRLCRVQRLACRHMRFSAACFAAACRQAGCHAPSPNPQGAPTTPHSPSSAVAAHQHLSTNAG